jgi:hypothetical protein
MDEPRNADHARDVVERHVRTATAALEAATCGHPLCRIGDGPDVMRPKFAEGGRVAAAELERLLKSSPASDPLEVVAETLTRWEDQRRGCPDHGGPRVAYLNGGVAQLRTIVEDLRTAADTGATS